MSPSQGGLLDCPREAVFPAHSSPCLSRCPIHYFVGSKQYLLLSHQLSGICPGLLGSMIISVHSSRKAFSLSSQLQPGRAALQLWGPASPGHGEHPQCLGLSIPKVSPLPLLCPCGPHCLRSSWCETCLPLYPAWPPSLMALPEVSETPPNK